VSTGLIIYGDDAAERGALAKKSFGVVVLDEAHKARAGRETRGGNTTVGGSIGSTPSAFSLLVILMNG
jgi:hypothetical protein